MIVEFLDGQSNNPFEAAPMLILADWLEEQGDRVSADVLRALFQLGISSISAMIFNIDVVFTRDDLLDIWDPKTFRLNTGHGWLDGFGTEGLSGVSTRGIGAFEFGFGGSTSSDKNVF